jgi:hypothetical protein
MNTNKIQNVYKFGYNYIQYNVCNVNNYYNHFYQHFTNKLVKLIMSRSKNL